MEIKIPEEILRYICFLSAKEGSARHAITLLDKCVTARNVEFTKEFIDKLNQSMEEKEWEIFVESLKKTEREFLNGVLDLAVKGEKITNKNIQRISKLSSQRISQLINIFVYDYIIIEFINNTKRGDKRYKELCFVSQETFESLLSVL